MVLFIWVVFSLLISFRGCLVCVFRLCRVFCGVEQSMGQGCVQRWFFVVRCQFCFFFLIFGCKGVIAFCLVDIYGVVWFILVFRQFILNENDEIFLCYWFWGQVDFGVQNSGIVIGLVVLRFGSFSFSLKLGLLDLEFSFFVD